MQENDKTIKARVFLKKHLKIDENTSEDQALQEFNKERGHLQAEYGNEKNAHIRDLEDALLTIYPNLVGKIGNSAEKESSKPQDQTPIEERTKKVEEKQYQLPFIFTQIEKPYNALKKIFNFSTFSINQPTISHESKTKWSVIDTFFLWCSGTDLDILSQCPHEKKKYVTMGIILLLVSVLATGSWSYAGFYAFKNYGVAIVFGLLCASLVFFIDRYLIISMKNYAPWYSRLLAALPRLVLAIFISIVVTFPLEMKIFEPEINARIEEKGKHELDSVLLSKKNEFNNDVKRLEDKDSVLKSHYLTITTELSSEQRKRDKARYKGIVESKLTEQKNKITEITSNENALTKLRAKKDTLNVTHQGEVKNVANTSGQMGGLMSRMDILMALSKESESGKVVLFLTLLFVILEAMPILLKLMSKTDSYDIILKNTNLYYEIEELKRKEYNEKILQIGYDTMFESDKTRIMRETQVQFEANKATEEKIYGDPSFSENGTSP